MTERALSWTDTAIDFLALVKPRVTALVMATTAGGLWLTPGPVELQLLFYTLFGTVLLVGAANTFNMYLERDIDALMKRTRDRPLPAKRMAPENAFVFGLVLAGIAVVILTLKVNSLTALLGVLAFVSYVLFYTPLKQKTTLSLLIGAVPGAMPPLMGWTAGIGSLDLPGLLLFGLLFCWQVPHFLAIALFHKEEYARAGIKILPLEKGETATKHCMVRYLALLIPVSLFLVPLGIAGKLYFWTAVVLNGIFFLWGCYGLRKSAGVRWARSFFVTSIIYLPVLLFVLALDSIH
ncbi:MAG: protoheme IX farnesyltransferase [Deltaproteobacteria bacterium]|nr:protoheme IX farnesyltransferase [Deltaproteobacteria bacterium]